MGRTHNPGRINNPGRCGEVRLLVARYSTALTINIVWKFTIFVSIVGNERKNANALRNHERLCKQNPDRDEHSLQQLANNRNKWNSSGHAAWNKGLTKDTDERIAKQANTWSSKYSGENNPFFGKTHTEETKQKISATQKENYKNLSRYATVREHRISYAEEYFNKIFVDAVKQYHVNRYTLDYAWPDKKLYIEVDGEQHYTEEGIAHDKERTDILLAEGWTCAARIRWSSFQAMTDEEKKFFVENVFTQMT